jgi:hypothetical protein
MQIDHSLEPGPRYIDGAVKSIRGSEVEIIE